MEITGSMEVGIMMLIIPIHAQFARRHSLGMIIGDNLKMGFNGLVMDRGPIPAGTG